MLENNTLREYTVTFENNDGVLYTQSILAISKQHAISSAINNNNKEKDPKFKGFVPVAADLVTDYNRISIDLNSLRENLK